MCAPRFIGFAALGLMFIATVVYILTIRGGGAANPVIFLLNLVDVRDFSTATIPAESGSTIRRSGAHGMSVTIATYRRARFLKLYIPHYLKVPFINEIIICDDFNSTDAKELRDWLAASDIPKHDQARVSIYNDTGERLGAFRNKVRAMSLARYSWVALLDSDNYGSPERYWDPLIQFWNSTYGSAPPPPGNRTAEIRAIYPGGWYAVSEPFSTITGRASFYGLRSYCTSNGDLIPDGGPPDPSPAVGRGCWEMAYPRETVLVSPARASTLQCGIMLSHPPPPPVLQFNLGNHVMHKATFLPPLREFFCAIRFPCCAEQCLFLCRKGCRICGRRSYQHGPRCC